MATSQLPPAITAELQQLLHGLASADNSVRSGAEASLNDDWMVVRPDVLLLGLAEQIAMGEPANVSCDPFRRKPVDGRGGHAGSERKSEKGRGQAPLHAPVRQLAAL